MVHQADMTKYILRQIETCVPMGRPLRIPLDLDIGYSLRKHWDRRELYSSQDTRYHMPDKFELHWVQIHLDRHQRMHSYKRNASKSCIHLLSVLCNHPDTPYYKGDKREVAENCLNMC